ncbi:MAG: hypothetical protein N4A46_16880 [Schleiferiaceae bacterium]|jgi:hypothetical protein|nr:hypothetical protein [Schleiferiaceae bacterium]
MPAIEKDVDYTIAVEDKMSYGLNFIIGFEQPGTIQKFEGPPTNPDPESGKSTWKTSLGKGKDIRGKELVVYVTARDENPKFKEVGVVLDLLDETNGETTQLDPQKSGSNHEKDTAKNQVVIFKHFIQFV